jgi:crotonobetainyl-CoA:carnitine CoA-transferase CaiB-like acyl-CoA transferase
VVPLLAGLRVVDLTTVIYGPLIGQVLGDLGAEVIKVEAPEGDIARETHPRAPDGQAAMFANNNRNKRGIVLDLRTEGGRDVLRRLLSRADVFVHNMRAKAIAKLGFGFADVAALNPNIVYLAALGFGSEGRWRDRPAYDDVIQAASGLASLPTYRGEDPSFVPGVMADKIAALYATYGVLAAIAARARGTIGAIEVESAMFESLTGFVLNEHLGAASFGAPPEDAGYHRMFAPARRPHRTADGWIAAIPYTGAQWRRVLEWAGRQDILDAPWFADGAERNRRIAELYEALSQALRLHPTAELLQVLERLDIPHAPVNRLDDVLRDPHLNEVGFFAPNGLEQTRALRQPVLYRGLPVQADRPAPRLGADGIAILREHGYDTAEIEALRRDGALRLPPDHREDQQ